MTISTSGVLHHKVNIGAFDALKYQEFINELSLIIGNRKTFIIMDNFRIHTCMEDKIDAHSIMIFPHYSPMLNPVYQIKIDS